MQGDSLGACKSVVELLLLERLEFGIELVLGSLARDTIGGSTKKTETHLVDHVAHADRVGDRV